MASDEAVFTVTPEGSEWHVDLADKQLLTLRTKEAAVVEAHVQAMSARPSRVTIYGADGSVEEQTVFPADDVRPEALAASSDD